MSEAEREFIEQLGKTRQMLNDIISDFVEVLINAGWTTEEAYQELVKQL